MHGQLVAGAEEAGAREGGAGEEGARGRAGRKEQTGRNWEERRRRQQTERQASYVVRRVQAGGPCNGTAPARLGKGRYRAPRASTADDDSTVARLGNWNHAPLARRGRVGNEDGQLDRHRHGLFSAGAALVTGVWGVGGATGQDRPDRGGEASWLHGCRPMSMSAPLFVCLCQCLRPCSPLLQTDVLQDAAGRCKPRRAGAGWDGDLADGPISRSVSMSRLSSRPETLTQRHTCMQTTTTRWGRATASAKDPPTVAGFGWWPCVPAEDAYVVQLVIRSTLYG